MHKSKATDWTEMPFFLAVAQYGSLRLAAQSIGVSHGTVDRHIQSLEAACGARLFKRTANGMVLTPAGESLVPAAEQAESLIMGARNALRSLDVNAEGTVRMTMPSWIAYPVVAPNLHKFRQQYPQIELDITVSNQFQKISNAEADVSIRVAFDVDEDVVGRRLFQWHDAVIASKAYLNQHWANRGKHGEGLHWIGWDGPNPDPAWQEHRPFPKAKVVHKTGDEILFAQLLKEGHGMGVYPVVFTHFYDEIIRVPNTPMLPDRSLWLLMHRDLQRSPHVRAVVDFFGEELMALRRPFQGIGAEQYAPVG